MRSTLKTTLIAAAGVALFALPAARAATPVPVAPTVPATPTAEDPDNAKRIAEIPNLRKARQQLLDVSKMLKNDIVDPKGYRHESLDLIDKAITNLTDEINEYKGDEPAKK